MSTPKHRNPSPNRSASAPYNFVPLPDAVVPAVASPDELPDQDRLDPDRLTGYFDVMLETMSPLYIRAPEQIDTFSEAKEDYPDFRQNPKNRPEFFYTRSRSEPVIPGSSLRGMLRNVIEIATSSKITKVDRKTRFFFRSVAAQGADPLKHPYIQVIGAMAKNVRAGYVVRSGDSWAIRPAKTPKECGIPSKDLFLKVKDEHLVQLGLPTPMSFKSSAFKAGSHPVTFKIDWDDVVVNGKKKRELKPVAFSLQNGNKHATRGTLVSSGNMMETSEEADRTPRKRHVLVMEANEADRLLPIESQAVEDYKASLTPFLLESYGNDGVLQEGSPIFYVAPDSAHEPVVYFGHTPNFRIPARRTIDGVARAVTPLDLVPAELRDPQTVDFAEALFGYVRADEELASLVNTRQGDKARAYAGRVTVGDALLEPGQKDIFMSPFTPRILASPKPTTFQHYLDQPSESLINLMHFGDDNARIRGYKRYWPQGSRARTDLRESDSKQLQDGEVPASSKQHTQIKPVNPGKRFRFRIHFENLSDEELGALCWTLQPSKDEILVHMLGMGKPFGMGSVRLTYHLMLIDAKRRYQSLFESESVREASPRERSTYTQAFVTTCSPAQPLHENERIQMLLSMMRWPGQPAIPSGDLYLSEQNRPNTRYMEIERGNVNEYDTRRVLPNPLAFPEPGQSQTPPEGVDPSPDSGLPVWVAEVIEHEDRSISSRSGPYEGEIKRVKPTNKGQEAHISSESFDHNLKFLTEEHGADESWKGRRVAFYVEIAGDDGPKPVDITLL